MTLLFILCPFPVDGLVHQAPVSDSTLMETSLLRIDIENPLKLTQINDNNNANSGNDNFDTAANPTTPVMPEPEECKKKQPLPKNRRPRIRRYKQTRWISEKRSRHLPWPKRPCYSPTSRLLQRRKK